MEAKCRSVAGASGLNVAPEERAMLWRCALGVVTIEAVLDEEKCAELEKKTETYYALQEELMPTMDKAKADPLNDGWTAYHQSLELAEFIKGDLNRLYLNGIEDEFFHTEYRQEVLSNVLMLWCMQHVETSYRQGMHEIAAPILWVLEAELEYYTTGEKKESPLASSLNRRGVEASLFWLFEAIMAEIEPLYDPVPRRRGGENVTDVVHFCTLVQETYLRNVDPELQHFLSVQGIYSQIYGMRWSRLLFGREYPMNDTGALKLWDFLFCSHKTLSAPSSPSSSADSAPEVTLASQSQLRAPRLSKKSTESSGDGGGSGGDGTSSKKKHGCCSDFGVLMNLCGDMMLAMLVSMRGALLEGDSNECLALLMHFSEGDRLPDILQMVQKIRSGVPVVSSDPRERAARVAPSSDEGGAREASGTPSSSSSSTAAAARPNWLAATGAMSASTPTLKNGTPSHTGHSHAAGGMSQLEADPMPSPAGGHRIGTGAATTSSERSFNEKASRKIQKGLGRLERGVGKLGQKIGEVGASVGSAMAQTADSFGSRLTSSTSTSSSSSSASSQAAQERRFETDLFGGGGGHEDPLGTPASFNSPTTQALSAPAPALATPARDKARARAYAAASSTTATSSALADRLLDVADDLNRKQWTELEEAAARRAGAEKLRLLAALLEGRAGVPMAGYDGHPVHTATLSLNRGEEMPSPPSSVSESEQKEEPMHAAAAAAAAPPPVPEPLTVKAVPSTMPSSVKRLSVSQALYESDADLDMDKGAKKALTGTTTNTSSTSSTAGRDKGREKEKDKHSISSDLAFLEEDGDDEFMFLSRPKPKSKPTDSVTDDALAILLGD